MPKRKKRTVDLVQVFTERDIFGDGSPPSRDPNEPTKLFFSIERPVSNTLYNNTPFGRAVAASYTSDTSTEWETTDEDEESETDGERQGGLSEDGKADQYCNCSVTPTPDNTDNNEPGGSACGSVAATTSKCDKCNKYKQNNVTAQNPELNKERKTKKTKKKQYHRCQLVRNFAAYTLDRPNSQIDNTDENPKVIITDEERERMFNELIERDELEEML